jgi:hypothetical protein
MNTSLKTLLGCFVTVFFLHACEKGTPLEIQSYMRLNLEAFYTDTSLYYQVKLNDKIVNERSAIGGNKLELLAGKDLEFVTSGRLVVTVVKKNSPNLVLDTTIFFTNFNELLLVQLDPTKKATLINKKTETVTLPKPGLDSVKVRFYYNIRRNGILLTNIDLQLYSYPIDSLFSNLDKPPFLTNEGRLRNVSRDVVNDYISVRYTNKDGKKLGYVFDIYPPSSTATTLPLYKKYYDEYDGYVGGAMELVPANDFQTVRVTRRTNTSTYRYGQFLFGFQ